MILSCFYACSENLRIFEQEFGQGITVRNDSNIWTPCTP